MLVFPAIDLLDGAGVRLEQGRRGSAKVYTKRPWEIAQRWAGLGVPRIHVVDLDAAFARAGGEARDNRATIEKIVAATTLEVEVGLADHERDDLRLGAGDVEALARELGAHDVAVVAQP